MYAVGTMNKAQTLATLEKLRKDKTAALKAGDEKRFARLQERYEVLHARAFLGY